MAESEGSAGANLSTPADIVQELRSLRAELEETRRELAESRRLAELGQIAAGIAHELRQPLGAIGAMAYLLRSSLAGMDRDRGASAEKLLNDIDGELALAGRIITNLLDYVRRRQPLRSPVNLNRLVERQAAKLRLPPEIHAETSLSPALPHVLVDSLHIERVVHNLLENAIAAMRSTGGALTLSTYQAGPQVILEIRDTGEGIAEEIREKVFQPLFSTRERGAGLGLALTRRLLEANDAQISFTSVPGQGTCFRLRFPTTASA